MTTATIDPKEENTKTKDVNIEIKMPRHLTIDEIRDGCVKISGNDDEDAKICMISEEFKQGIDGVQPYKQSVTFYGSARFTEGDVYYEKARRLANRIALELKYAVVTGGGPGIMEAANRGTFEAKGKSVGLTIKLPHEQSTNAYVTDSIPFYFFFARKVALSFMAEVCLFYPGGFGTFDELFGMLTLIQTGKIQPVPIILVGSEFWKPFDEVIKAQMLDKNQTIGEGDRAIYQIIDDEDQIIEIIRMAKLITANGL